MRTTILFFILLFLLIIGNVIMLKRIWHRTDIVEITEHVSLDTAKYKILKEDSVQTYRDTSLPFEGMKIKRIYYLHKR
ncbi:hypothetical protein CCP2SC5_920009 [Azospirillaceae bacterium]